MRLVRSTRLVPALFALTLFATPALAQSAECTATGRGKSSTSISDNSSGGEDDRRRTIRWTRGDCELTVRSRGDVEPTVAFDDIAKLSSRGWIEIEERTGDVVRRFEAREKDGQIERRWSLDGDANRFDVDRKQWLARTLLAVERRTGTFADVRVPALLKSGGVDALLREAGLLEGDYARKLYLTAALQQPNLADRDVVRVIGVVDSMSSDYERGQVLQAVAARKQPMSDEVVNGFVRAARSMSSDYEKRRALSAAIASGAATRVRGQLYDAASTISSDYERATLLLDAQKRGGGVDAKDRDAYFRAVKRFSSDYERKRTLTGLIAEKPADETVLLEILRATKGMSSDYERGEVLRAFARTVAVRGDLRDEYMASAKDMKSDYEYRRVLQALVSTERSF